MGGGRGPGRIIPEQSIVDGLNNNGTFTLAENETSTLTQTLTVTTGQTLTIEGTLDLGNGNTLQVDGEGEVIVTGTGTITNTAANIQVIDSASMRLESGANIVIDGNLAFEDNSRLNFVFAASSEQTRINVNVLSIIGNATLNYLGRDSDTDSGISFNPFIFLLGFIGAAREHESTKITIKEGGFLNIEEGSELKLDSQSQLVLNKDATMNCKGTLVLGCNPRKNDGDKNRFPQFSIENQGQINVTDRGKIIADLKLKKL